jgi:(E)-4-hydroxy-3-methylbut-2-enyl-diphosphate synthase
VVNGPGEALLTDIGLTGGGAGRHMVYLAGRTDHTVEGGAMIDHIVELVERRAEAIRAAEAEAAGRAALAAE